MSDVEYLPLTGDAAGLRGSAHRASRASSALDDAQAVVRRVAAALDGQHSDAVAGARRRLTEVLDRLAACSGGLGSAAATFGGHADVLERQQAAAAHAIARRDDALARIRQHEAALWAGGGFTWNAAPGVEPAWRAATENDLFTARAEVAAAEAQWRDARDAKRASALRAASVLGGLADVRAVRAASLAGTSTADYRASWLQGQRVAALLGAAGGGGDRAERRRLRADLHDLLVTHADDAVFWQSFWDAAAPQDVYLALGPNFRDPTAPPDAALRAALSSGAEAWARTATRTEREEFGAAVIDSIGRWSGFEARADLAATLLPPTLPAAVHGGAYDALVARWDEAGDDRFGREGTAVVGIAVAAGLIRHPRLAFDKLAPADEARLSRQSRAWFGWAAHPSGTPRSGWPDGGAAVAGALRTAVREGSDSSARADQARAAMLVAHATRDMREGLLSTPVSDAASTEIATAYEPYLPSFAEADDGRMPGVTDDIRMGTGAGRPPTAVQPELDALALQEVIAATSHGPQGADAWLHGADALQAEVIERVTSSTHDDNTAARTSLGQRYMHDVGFLTGAMEADTMSTARSRMEQRKAVVDLIGLGSSWLPRFTSIGVTTTVDILSDSMLDPVDIARDEVLATGSELRRQFAAPVYEAVIEHDMTTVDQETGATYTPEEAEARAAGLAPDDPTACAVFGNTYNDAANVQPELGDNECTE